MDKNKFKDNVKTIELYDVDNVIDFITTELNINKEKYAIFFCDIISCGYNTSTIDYEKAAENINKKIKCIECDCLYDNFDNYIDYEQAERLYNFIKNNIGYFINNKVRIRCVDLYSLNEFEVVVDEDDKDNSITMLKNNNSILSVEYVNNESVITGGNIDNSKEYIVGLNDSDFPELSKIYLNRLSSMKTISSISFNTNIRSPVSFNVNVENASELKDRLDINDMENKGRKKI